MDGALCMWVYIISCCIVLTCFSAALYSFALLHLISLSKGKLPDCSYTIQKPCGGQYIMNN